jgi:hypothetical protein
MAGLVPAIHASPRGAKNVDARDKPGHDDRLKQPSLGQPASTISAGIAVVPGGPICDDL